MFNTTTRKLIFIAGGIFFTGVAVARASDAKRSAPQSSVSSLVSSEELGRADFVFVGSVSSVDYRMSEAKRDHAVLPHTFVTYKIERVLRGKAPGNFITLRFLGGQGKGTRVMMPEGYPLFDKGDRDMLLVSGNTVSGCPLVGCETGRFRFVNDQVYTEDGREVLFVPGRGPIAGKRVDLPQFSEHNLGGARVRKVTVNELGEVADEPTIRKGVPATTATWLQFVQKSLANLAPTDKKVLSADHRSAFYVRAPHGLNAPEGRSIGEAGPRNETREEQLYRANQNNPVIPGR